jgi:hypothetical protein
MSRPTTGVPVHTRIPADEVWWLEESAAVLGITRAEMIRRVLAAAREDEKLRGRLRVPITRD